MPIEISIDAGPDAGRHFRINSTSFEARFGRQPGCHAVINDPSWDGVIRIDVSQARIRVTNEMKTPIYFDNEVFAPTEQKVWYEGMVLQPTADTSLRLQVVPSDPDADEDEDLQAFEEIVDRGTPKGERKKQFQYGVILLCVPLIVLLFFLADSPDTDDDKSPERVREEYVRVRNTLRETDSDPKYGNTSKAIRPLLDDARYFEQWNRPAEALDRYLKARAEIQTSLGRPAPILDIDVPDSIRDSLAFVSERIVKLSPRVRYRRS